MIFTLFDRSALYQVMTGDSSKDDFQYYQKETDGYDLTSSNTGDPWAAASKVTVGDGLKTVKAKPEYLDQVMPIF
jgi:hypothetical protein